MKQVRRLILLMVTLMVSFPLWAASRQVTGTITDEAGEPLIGVSVMLDKSRTGCMTDIDGNFSLQIPEGEATLKIVYVGYEPADQGRSRSERTEDCDERRCSDP